MALAAGTRPAHRDHHGFADVERLIGHRFPGVALESPIQGYVYLERFEEGIEAYNRLAAPTARDERWLGVCYFQRAQDLEALEAFFRAVAHGEEAARINLAHVLRFVERGDESVAELRAVEFDRLSDYDKVLFLRVTSIHEENNGNLREALRAAEDAWKRIQGLPEFSILAPSILAQLGVLHGRIGRAQRALWFMERGLQITDGLEHQKVRLRRASVLSALGRHNEALAELGSVERQGLPPGNDPEVHMLFGEISWAQGRIEDAGKQFELCVERSTELQVTYEEFIARLALTALAGLEGDLVSGRSHLGRAQALIIDKSDRLAFRFREIGLHLQTGDYTRDHGLNEYEALDEEFGRMGLLQEQGFVKLHKAALFNRLDNPRYLTVLDELQSLCVTLQNHAFLAKEWLLLPDLRRAAKRTHSQLLGEENDTLEIRTLGEEALLYGGERVTIPLRRLVEVVAYFLEHKAVSLNKLLVDIFPDEKPRSARSYFHQCRHQLKENIAAVQIEYDAEARLYRLKSEIDIVWDVAEVRAGRRKGGFGLFLPSSGNDWALMVDHGLERFRDSDDIAA
jgi:tetratricopeptide (TPR) repeat protein